MTTIAPIDHAPIDPSTVNVADFPRNAYGDVDYQWLVTEATGEQFRAWCQFAGIKPTALTITAPTVPQLAESKTA